MSIWFKIIIAIVSLGLIVMLLPTVKVSLEESRKAKERDWLGVLVPIVLVGLFVYWLILIA